MTYVGRHLLITLTAAQWRIVEASLQEEGISVEQLITDALESLCAKAEEVQELRIEVPEVWEP